MPKATRIFAFIVLCIYLYGAGAQPFKIEKDKEIIYQFKSDGGVVSETLSSVSLNVDFNDLNSWERDCKSAFIAYANKLIGALEIIAKDANSETKEKLLAGAKSLEMITKNIINCELTRDKNSNSWLWHEKTEWTMEDYNTYETLVEKFTGSSAGVKIEKKDGGFSVKLPRPTVEIEKLKIKIDGQLTKLSPSNYKVEDQYYVFLNPNKLWAASIVLEYKPIADTIKPSPTKTPQKTTSPTQAKPTATPAPSATPSAEQGVSIFGQAIPLSPKNLLYITLVFISIIGLIIVFAFIRSKAKETQKQQPKEKILPLQKPEMKKEEQKQQEFVDLKSETVGSASMKLSHAETPDFVVETKRSLESEKAGEKLEYAPAAPVFKTKEYEEKEAEASRRVPKEPDYFEGENIMESEKEGVMIRPLDESKSRAKMRETTSTRKAGEEETLSEADLKTIERALAALEPEKSKYKPEQLRKVMLEMDYKENVVNYIIKKLYES